MKDNVVKSKSFTFALRIIKLYKYLCDEHREYVMSKQLLRCGTSIGANIEEALGGQSDKDFVAKVSIAYKEARETGYWLQLLHESDFLDDIQFHSIDSDLDELKKLLSSILITMKKKINK
ncbi:four helix bundle protein [bacterium]|nr:four helix bundle protein [bacterium]